jgi:hypothetical protein
MFKPHYYLMQDKKILRLEEEQSFETLSQEIKGRSLKSEELICLDQDQANWRVVIFRDEIMELDEYLEYLAEAPESEELEYAI